MNEDIKNNSLLDSAIKYHHQGNYAKAKQMYSKIIESDRENAKVLHNLALIHNQEGNSETSIELILAALEIQPTFRKAMLNLANIFAALGKYSQALIYYKKLVKHEDRDIEVWLRLASCQTAMKKYDNAMNSLQQVLIRDPNNVRALTKLAKLSLEMDDCEESIRLLKKAISISQPSTILMYDLAVSYHRANMTALSIQQLTYALDLDSDHELSLSLLGKLLINENQLEEARSYLIRSLTVNASHADNWNRLGLIERRLGNFESAKNKLEKSLELNPKSPSANNNMGNLYQNLHRYKTALEHYDKAIIENHEFADAHVNRAFTLLSMGNLRKGLKEFEWRTQLNLNHYRSINFLKKNSKLYKHILVIKEQGFGDSIQFSRYLQYLENNSIKYKFIVQSELLSLLKKNFKSISDTDELDTHCYDAVIPLMSLPYVYDIPLDSYKNPYLTVFEKKIVPIDSALSMQKRINIGISWKGNPDHKNDRFRSININQLARLFKCTQVNWHSLQLNDSESPEIHNKFNIEVMPNQIENFEDTAAIIDKLDLVVCVDSSIAHLAGAMGKPVKLLIPYNCDWRWANDTIFSQWYPNTKLYKQQKLLNWEQPIESIRKDIMTENNINES